MRPDSSSINGAEDLNPFKSGQIFNTVCKSERGFNLAHEQKKVI